MAARRQDRLRSTYDPGDPPNDLARFVDAPPAETLRTSGPSLDALTDRYRAHTFDLLGSGWVRVRPGMEAAGLEGHRYTPGQRSSGVNQANRRPSARVRALISEGYQPIDWQLDFKSGFRWNESTWYRDLDYGHDPGADVKVPWELGRCQHLPILGLRACLARDDGDVELRAALASEFRDQVLDFIAANPPRFGVQWVTAMDVAIRVCNWLVAYDLFRAADHAFDRRFEGVFRRSIVEHGRHIAANLEWSDELRGNHYLADVVGLVFVAAYLPPSELTDAWLAFGTRELLREIDLQFHDDGGGFEGSTCYHRLSAEMAVYATAILLALPPERVQVIGSPGESVLAAARELPGEPLGGLELWSLGNGRQTPVGRKTLARIGRARTFTLDLTKPDGRVPQIGDNDSGRFLRLAPVLEETVAGDAIRRFGNLDHIAMNDPHEPYLLEDHLDHAHLDDAISGLLGRTSSHQDQRGIDGSIVNRLARPLPEWASLGVSGAEHVKIGGERDLSVFERRVEGLDAPYRRVIRIDVGHDITGLRRFAYPDFGAYVWRSERLFLCIRCGPRGQNGFGGHDHNDQLSISLAVDGEDWILDPGTYVYTPLPVARNRYRSQRSHFGPQVAGPEPASLDEGPFALGPGGEATCIYWGEGGFAGTTRSQDGRIAMCRIEMAGDEITVTHASEGAPLLPVSGEASDWRAHLPRIAHSPGYGIVERL